MTHFTFIDLFAGIGGMRIAFQNAGGKCVFSSEIDKHAAKTYAENFGENGGKGIKLKVFSGREAKLNLLIFMILPPEGKLSASYDIYREVHATKGFRRRGKQNVDRRAKALFLKGWLKTVSKYWA